MSNDELVLAALAKLSEVEALLRLMVSDRKFEINGVPADLEYLDTKLETIDFGKGYNTRLQAMFIRHSIYISENKWKEAPLVTVRDLIKLKDFEIMREPNIGRLAVGRINAVLALRGLRLGMRL